MTSKTTHTPFFYVYRITCTHPDSPHRYYYGSRGSRVPPEQDVYWSSSRSLRAAIQVWGLQWFRKKILRRCKTRRDAVLYEIELHRRFNVKAHPLFFNRANQTSAGYQPGPLTEIHKRRLSAALKTYYAEHPEHAKAVSESLKQRNAQVKQAFARNRLGVHQSENSKERISQSLLQYYASLSKEHRKQRATQISLGMKRVAQRRVIPPMLKTCPWCQKSGSGPTMYRWHFSNCTARNLDCSAT